MFARISASRSPLAPLDAFAGGSTAHSVLSGCLPTLLCFFDTPAVLPLRATCSEARNAIARHPWQDAETPIQGSLAAWRACFPAARTANATPLARPGCPRQQWRVLQGLHVLLVLGASKGLLSQVHGALPGVRVVRRLLAPLEVGQLAHGEPLWSLAALEGGLLAAGSKHSLNLWRVEPGSGAVEPAGSAEGVRCYRAIAALPQGRLAVKALGGVGVTVWGASPLEPTCELPGDWEDSNVQGVVGALSNGSVVASNGNCCRVYALDATGSSGSHTATLADAYHPWSLVQLTDGWVVGAGGLGWGDFPGLKAWDLSKHACGEASASPAPPTYPCQELLLEDGCRPPDQAALAALGQGRVASGGKGGAVHLWHPATGRLEAVLAGHKRAVTALAGLPMGLLASSSNDATLRVWSVAARACLAVVAKSHTLFPRVTHLAALPGGRLACVTSGRWSGQGLLSVWELGLG